MTSSYRIERLRQWGELPPSPQSLHHVQALGVAEAAGGTTLLGMIEKDPDRQRGTCRKRQSIPLTPDNRQLSGTKRLHFQAPYIKPRAAQTFLPINTIMTPWNVMLHYLLLSHTMFRMLFLWLFCHFTPDWQSCIANKSRFITTSVTSYNSNAQMLTVILQ